MSAQSYLLLVKIKKLKGRVVLRDDAKKLFLEIKQVQNKKERADLFDELERVLDICYTGSGKRACIQALNLI